MSSVPPPLPPLLPPLEYATAFTPRIDPRPQPVRVIGMLAVIFGIIAVLGAIGSILGNLGIAATQNPMVSAIRQDSLLRNTTIATMVIHLSLGILQLTSGIAALKLKPTGRSGLICFAVLNLVTSIVGGALNLLFVHPRMQLVLQNMIRANPVLYTPTVQQVMKYSTYAGYVAGIAFLVWPVMILRYLYRPDIKAAFEKGD